MFSRDKKILSFGYTNITLDSALSPFMSRKIKSKMTPGLKFREIKNGHYAMYQPKAFLRI